MKKFGQLRPKMYSDLIIFFPYQNFVHIIFNICLLYLSIYMYIYIYIVYIIYIKDRYHAQMGCKYQ